MTNQQRTILQRISKSWHSSRPASHTSLSPSSSSPSGSEPASPLSEQEAGEGTKEHPRPTLAVMFCLFLFHLLLHPLILFLLILLITLLCIFGVTSLQIISICSHLLNVEQKEYDSLFDTLKVRAFQRHYKTRSVLLKTSLIKQPIQFLFNQPKK